MAAKICVDPLRGYGVHVQPEVSTLMMIPGRPQSRSKNSAGESLAVSQRYLNRVRRMAHAIFGADPAPEKSIRLIIRLYYVLPPPEPPQIGQWHEYSIPRADRAPEIIIQGLTGHLYVHPSQINPLTVYRAVVSSAACTEAFGAECAEGAAMVIAHGQ